MAYETPKTNWVDDEVIEATELNKIGENTVALKSTVDTLTTRQKIGVYQTFGSASTASTSYVDLSSVSLTTLGGNVLVTVMTGLFLAAAASGAADIRLSYGSTTTSSLITIPYTRSSSLIPVVTCHYITSLAAGTYTFMLQWRHTGGSTVSIPATSDTVNGGMGLKILAQEFGV